jgi:signal transduction histidine kinase
MRGNGMYNSLRQSKRKSVSFPVLNSWIELKSGILNVNPAQEAPNSSLDCKIEDFRLSLNLFTSSPIGFQYKINRPEHLQYLADIDAAAMRLNKALKEGGGAEILSIILEIDSHLDQLRLIEKSLSDNTQLNYFLLFFFFSMCIISIVIAYWLLNTRLEKTEARRRQSAAFSRETIIAQEQERMRISRELHDTVAQDLWRLLFQTDLISKSEDAAGRSRICAEVYNSQNELMIRVRNICDNLIPPDFQYGGLEGALLNLCGKFKQRTGIDCRLTIPENLQTGSFNIDDQLQCFRIVQECLSNIEKHSEAAVAPVVIRNDTGDELLVIISDNGKGFIPPDRASCEKLKEQGHYGLWSVYERAASLNGTLAIDSEAGEGTTITLRVPLKGEV